MEVIMAVDMGVMVSDSDIEDMDMVMVLEATAMLTTTARDLLRPNPRLMPDICTEDMDMADMVATDVDTDMVLVTMVDMADMVATDVDMAMVCGEDKYSANFPL